MSKITRMQAGELTRSTKCNFCGELHRRHSKEERECRKRARRGKPPLAKQETPPPADRDHNRGPSTLRQKDPLGGNPRAHTAAKQLRQGRSRSWVAKNISLPRAEVDRIAKIIELEND